MENNGISKAELLSLLDEVQQDAIGILQYDFSVECISDDATVRALGESFLERTERLIDHLEEGELAPPKDLLEDLRRREVASIEKLLHIIPLTRERLRRQEIDLDVCYLMDAMFQMGFWYSTLASARETCAPETMQAWRSILGTLDGPRGDRTRAEKPFIDKFEETCREQISKRGGVIRNVRAFVDGVLDTLPELKKMTKPIKNPKTKEVAKKAKVGIRYLQNIVRNEIKPKHHSR